MLQKNDNRLTTFAVKEHVITISNGYPGPIPNWLPINRPAFRYTLETGPGMAFVQKRES